MKIAIILVYFFFPGLGLGQEKSSFTSWAIDPTISSGTIQLDQALKKYQYKKTIVVAVIDTGIDHNHPFLKDNLYVNEGAPSSNNYGLDFSYKNKETTTPQDDHGHGTHVSGIIKSVFSQVKILSLKYYNPNNSGQENLNSTIKSLEYAINANVDIINYSGGGPEPSAQELKALKLAEQKGILVVAAAGNEHSDIDNKKNAYYPASYRLSNIITVTAHNQEMEVLPSSNWGKTSVDLSAPGNKIQSGLPYGRSGTMTGTSQATAFVSGVAALIKSQFPELDAKAIRKILISSAKKVPSLKDKCFAQGMVNAANALDMAQIMMNENKGSKTSLRSYQVENVQSRVDQSLKNLKSVPAY